MSQSPWNSRWRLLTHALGGLLFVLPAARLFAEEPAAGPVPTVFTLDDPDLLSAMRPRPERISDEVAEVRGRLHGRLLPLMLAHERGGREDARAFASRHKLPVHNDRVTIIIVPAADTSPQAVADVLRPKGASVLRIGRDHVLADVPIGHLRGLAAEGRTIGSLQLPLVPKPEITSEGVALTNAGDRQLCYTGRGMKVAVIDGGFIGLSAAQDAGKLPIDVVVRDETGTGIETGTVHGTGVAEIVHDMAPDAQLYLIKIGNNSHLQAAKNFCVAEGVQVINHSMGWYGVNFYDGAAYSSVTPSPVAIANDAADNGILWVNAAGNDHRAHWLGPWTDSNNSGWLDWAPGVEVNQLGYLNSGAIVVLHLVWNNWPTTDQDYDLYLFRWVGNSWRQAAASWNDQTGSQPPNEYIGVQISTAGYYAVAVNKYDASGDSHFILRSWYQNLEYWSGSGSIGCPADAASVLAVGAMDWNVYPSGSVEWFSSRGPNSGAYTGMPVLTKPDLCGPDRVSTMSYGTYPSGFAGTSASSPHLAGAAALVFEQFPEYTAEQVRAYLESQTIDLGSPGKNNIYGYGTLVFDDLPDGFGDACQECAAPVIVEARSIKIHGAAGEFAINLLMPGAIEPRVGGPDRIEIVFDRSIQPADGTLDDEVTLSSGEAALSLASTYDPQDTLVITLSSPPDGNACLSIQVSGLADAIAPVPAPSMCLMVPETLHLALVQGEVNLQPPVDIQDLSLVREQLYEPVTSDNFTRDVNADGIINILDLSSVRENLYSSASCP